MRVLIIFNHPAPYKVNSFNELSKLVDLTVLFERTSAKDRPESFYSGNKYDFKTIFLKDCYFGNEGSYSNGVRKYLKAHHQDFDVILMNGYSHLAEIKAINFLHKKGIKFGLLINGGVIKKETSLKKKYKSSLIKKADYYISPNASSNRYLEYYGADKNRIYNYIYSNLSSSDILTKPISDKSEYRKKFNLPLDKRIFINPSQFIERKNNLELISLFKNRDDVLVMVGDGIEKEKYESYIKDNNLTNVYIFPYMKKDQLFELYKASDCHITLSNQDIFGHTILESFANGVPVIASNKVVSSIEFIKNGYNGYIVDNQNKDDIIDKMNRLTKDMSLNALETAKDKTFKNVAKSIYDVLEKIYEK